MQHTSTIIKLGVLLVSLWFLPACEDHSSKTATPVNHGEFNPGLAIYGDVENYMAQSENGARKVAALHAPCSLCNQPIAVHRDRIILAVNNIFEAKDTSARTVSTRDSGNNQEQLIKTLYNLIDDGTLPQLSDSLGLFLQEIGGDPGISRALTDFLNTRTGTNFHNIVELLRKMLKNPKSDEVCRTVARLVQNNPDLLKNVFRLLSDALVSIPETQETCTMMDFLSKEVSDKNDLGDPAWLARLDANNNPKVRGQGSTMPAPFVDKNDDGICDVDGQGRPVDADGHVLQIPALAQEEYQDHNGNILIRRDNYGRAVTPNGELVFEYYDAKRTVLGLVLYNLRPVLQQHILRDLYLFGKIALLPKKPYADEQGNYEGYADDGELVKACVGALDLLKTADTRLLLKGFARLFVDEQHPNTARLFMVGFAKVVFKLRDEPLPNVDTLMVRMMQMIMFGEVPEIKQALLEMGAINYDLPEPTNMYTLFYDWLTANIDKLGRDAMWPLRNALRNVRAAYPEDTQLTERLYTKVMEILFGTASLQRGDGMANVISMLLEYAAADLAVDTETKIESMKLALQNTVKSRCLASLMQCLDSFILTPEATTLEDAIIYCVTPQANSEDEVYGELARVGVGFLECRRELQVRVRLLKLLGKFLNPNRPIAVKLMESLGRLLVADNHLIILKTLRAAFTKCERYRIAPVLIFGHVGIDILRTGSDPFNCTEISLEDVQKMVSSVVSLFLSPDEMIQRIYRVIRNRSHSDH